MVRGKAFAKAEHQQTKEPVEKKTQRVAYAAKKCGASTSRSSQRCSSAIPETSSVQKEADKIYTACDKLSL